MNLVAVIEWTWTLLAVVGVLACLWALADGYLDRAEQRRNRVNGLSQIVVRMNLRTAHASGVLHSFFLILGIGALLTPDRDFAPTIGLYGGAYILVAATNVRALLLNQVDRIRVRRAALRRSTITGTADQPAPGGTPVKYVREDPDPKPPEAPAPDEGSGGESEGSSEN